MEAKEEGKKKWLGHGGGVDTRSLGNGGVGRGRLEGLEVVRRVRGEDRRKEKAGLIRRDQTARARAPRRRSNGDPTSAVMAYVEIFEVSSFSEGSKPRALVAPSFIPLLPFSSITLADIAARCKFMEPGP